MNYENKVTHPKFLALMSKGRRLQNSGFTLVELIVVITILAILGTIAFISLQGYSRDARDSIRISDLSTMKTSLELFNLDAGKYPVTTDGFQVTYSGSEIWTQGEFGSVTTSSVDRLDEIPSDPLTEIKYTYSTTINRQEFQLAGLVEGSDLGFNGILSEANAGDTVATAIVTGNYNGMMLKTSTGGVNCAILALPSIISNKDSSVTDVVDILTNSGLVYTGYNNIPSNYIGSKYKVDEGFEFIGNNLVAYSDADSCSELYNADDNAARVELITGLQTAYTGTIIANTDGISNITTIDTNDITAVDLLSSTLVTNSLGGSVIVSSGGGEVVLGTYQEQGLCNEPDIHVPVGCNEGDVGCYVIASCNLGSTVAGTTIGEYGELFQWGNNAGIKYADTSDIQISITLTGSTYGNNIFIIDTHDWNLELNNDIWGNIPGTDIDRKGPCPELYHIPSFVEWNGLETAGGWSNNGTSMSNELKLPMAGYRDRIAGVFGWVGAGYYWSSSPDITNGRYFRFNSGDIATNTQNRAHGLSIRCFKN